MEENGSNQYNIATAPKDTLKNQVLWARSYAIRMMHNYDEIKLLNANPQTNGVKAAIKQLYHLVRIPLQQEDLKLFEEIELLITSKHIDDFVNVFWKIDSYLYKKKLTAWEDSAKIEGW